MAVLATSELKKLVSESGIISALNDYNIQGSSIDLSIGEQVSVPKQRDLINLFEDQEPSELYEQVDLAKGYRLEPECYMYGSSVESIKIPLDLCGFILPRSSFARIGLVLPMSMYANPGYEGHLPIIIYNASKTAVMIPPYYRVCQLVLMELKGEARPYEHQKDVKYHKEKPLKSPSFKDVELEQIFERLK